MSGYLSRETTIGVSSIVIGGETPWIQLNIGVRIWSVLIS